MTCISETKFNNKITDLLVVGDFVVVACENAGFVYNFDAGMGTPWKEFATSGN